MQKIFFLLFFVLPIIGFGQKDSVDKTEKDKMRKHSDESSDMKIFYSQKVINANTVEVLPKGVMEFRVTHGFHDIGGTHGGLKNFFGLEDVYDVRIGFQAGLTNRLNVLLARDRGASGLSRLYELGLKYQFLKQGEDNSHPFSLTLFANSVVSTMDVNPDIPESKFQKFSDRTSEVVQLIIARKFGKVSLQLSPTYVTRGLVLYGDEKNLFAIGAAIRVPITPRFAIVADYFHTFRSQQSKDIFGDTLFYKPAIKFYDALGVGFEILTAGHVFHLNFTNATELLENRFIPGTVKSWGRGEFHWSFILSRNFTIFRDKKSKLNK